MMSPQQRMITILKSAVIKGLDKHQDLQLNFISSAARQLIATEILKEISIAIETKNFKEAMNEDS